MADLLIACYHHAQLSQFLSYILCSYITGKVFFSSFQWYIYLNITKMHLIHHFVGAGHIWLQFDAHKMARSSTQGKKKRLPCDLKAGSSWPNNWVFMLQQLGLHAPTTGSSWPNNWVFMPQQLGLHAPTTGSSWPNNWVFMLQQLGLHEPTTGSSWPNNWVFMT